jgi:hypothetical protein
VKQNHLLFPKDFIEKALKDAPGRVHIALEETTKDEVELIALGYRYSRKTILFFILTKNAGATQLGEPYHMKHTNSYGNVCTCNVNQPEVILNYFAHSNTIDVHNQLCQDLLKLEKKWIMQDPFFHLGTTMIGINVTDAYLLANYHGVINVSRNGNEEKEKQVSIQRFAGILANNLLTCQRGFRVHCFVSALKTLQTRLSFLLLLQMLVSIVLHVEKALVYVTNPRIRKRIAFLSTLQPSKELHSKKKCSLTLVYMLCLFLSSSIILYVSPSLQYSLFHGLFSRIVC